MSLSVLSLRAITRREKVLEFIKKMTQASYILLYKLKCVRTKRWSERRYWTGRVVDAVNDFPQSTRFDFVRQIHFVRIVNGHKVEAKLGRLVRRQTRLIPLARVSIARKNPVARWIVASKDTVLWTGAVLSTLFFRTVVIWLLLLLLSVLMRRSLDCTRDQ